MLQSAKDVADICNHWIQQRLEHGCEEAQGYLFGAPMSAEDFTELITRTGHGVLPRANVPDAKIGRAGSELPML